MNAFVRIPLIVFGAVVLLAMANSSKAVDVDAVMAKCADCHGKNGASTDRDEPVIGGMSAAYLEETLNAYKAKERPCPETEFKAGPKKGSKTTMCEAVQDLAAADIKRIAEFLAKQKFAPAVQAVDAALAAKGAVIHEQSCEKCHSANGTAADDDAGILGGQWIPYLKEQIADFKSGARKGDDKNKMRKVLQDLDAKETDAVLNFYASQK